MIIFIHARKSPGTHIEVRRQFAGVDSLYHVGFRDQAWVIRFGGKHLSLLSHLTVQGLGFDCIQCFSDQSSGHAQLLLWCLLDTVVYSWDVGMYYMFSWSAYDMPQRKDPLVKSVTHLWESQKILETVNKQLDQVGRQRRRSLGIKEPPFTMHSSEGGRECFLCSTYGTKRKTQWATELVFPSVFFSIDSKGQG